MVSYFPLCESAFYYDRLAKVNDLKEKKVYCGKWFQRFQFMVA